MCEPFTRRRNGSRSLVGVAEEIGGGGLARRASRIHCAARPVLPPEDSVRYPDEATIDRDFASNNDEEAVAGVAEESQAGRRRRYRVLQVLGIPRGGSGIADAVPEPQVKDARRRAGEGL
jgi:hypothetical protein